MTLPKILIIDDEIDIGEILEEYLEDDFSCTVCSEPEDGLQKIKDNKFDIIISDMHMPEVNGFEIINVAIKEQPSTPILLLTGSSSDDPEIVSALEKGAKGVITKPFKTPDTLIEYINKFIQ